MATPTVSAATDLAAVLDARTTEGALYERLADGKLRCVACGHRCVIFPGHRGICQVRFNEGGTLRVPWGYVAALQCDPTEKKPFFHVLPGSKTLTFGMLGCDYHCPYCFTNDTVVATNQGPLRIEDVFNACATTVSQPDGEIAFPTDLRAYSHRGRAKQIRAVFRHPYEGPVLKVRPAFFPVFECTPDHRLLAIARPRRGNLPGTPAWTQARELTREHCLAIPKRYRFSETLILDVPSLLDPMVDESRMRRGVPRPEKCALSLPLAGGTRRLVSDGERVRIFNEHAPGFPLRLPLTESLAALLGYYCAEGYVWQDTKRRINGATLTFSFGRKEVDSAYRVQSLLREIFGVTAIVENRTTTCAVVCHKASVGHLFKALCGPRAKDKRVARPLFQAPRAVVEAFLRAYVEGAGAQSGRGFVQTASVSKELALGIAWLALKLGYVPSLAGYKPVRSPIEGRPVERAPQVFHVRWHEKSRRRHWEDEDYYYVPIRAVEAGHHQGYVFNLEVDEDHSYLAGFIAASNCQNYITSQALRDPVAGAAPEDVTPDLLVDLGLRSGVRLVGSSYNEPLITAEWAVDVFKKARAAGLRTCFISNGNATPEALEFLRPWCDAYKIDLKSMSQKNYRYLGGVLERVLDTIKMVHAMGFWMEIVTLVIPGWNDSDKELRQAAEFIASISPDIPWHVTAFHPDYKMTEYDYTQAGTLLRAARLGEAAGLRFVYAGNLPGRVGPYEHTFCPRCRALLVERVGYHIRQNRLAATGGRCPDCGAAIPGIWS
ncbi:MAG: radical SAM protein [Armatimonadetes bacterium]|nr:radical SAM protein [Armatimonadota bacterium]